MPEAKECKTCGDWDFEARAGSDCPTCSKVESLHPEVFEWVKKVVAHQVEEQLEEHLHDYRHKSTNAY
jgi:hypothetical protein